MENLNDYFSEKQAHAAYQRDGHEPRRQAPPFQTFRADQLPDATVPGCFHPEFDIFPWVYNSDNPRHKKALAEHIALSKLSPPQMRRLVTARQEAFCLHYAATRNAAAAARLAGWKPSSAATIGHRLLLRMVIRHRVAQHLMFQTLHDQATPAQALALVMSALNGGPDPELRLKAAARIMDIYRTNQQTGFNADPAPATQKSGSSKKTTNKNKVNTLNINNLIEDSSQLLSTSLHNH